MENKSGGYIEPDLDKRGGTFLRDDLHLFNINLKSFLLDHPAGELCTHAFLKRSREVDQLHNVSMRLEALAEHHPSVSAALITIAETVRNAATPLEMLVATRGPKPI